MKFLITIVLWLACLTSKGLVFALTPPLKSTTISSFFRNIAENIVDSVMHSPLNSVLLRTARDTMIKSVEATGLKWKDSYQQLVDSQDWHTAIEQIQRENPNVTTPSYYFSPFHAYDQGNLCFDAAFEQEIAGKAVGIRHFPAYKEHAEEHMRDLFDDVILRLGGTMIPINKVEENSTVVVDFGCGTGTSTRRLANLFKNPAIKILGIDLSPHMIAVGRLLQETVPTGQMNWLENIEKDDRISLLYDDIANTSTFIASNSVSFVNIAFVLHELPVNASRDILKEAYRILQPGGVLNIIDMDPDSPGYQRARANPFLFAIFQSTEPFLEEYFDVTYPILCSKLLPSMGFQNIIQTDATSRYLAVQARKPLFSHSNTNNKDGIADHDELPYLDLRDASGSRELMDTHLQPLRFQ